MEQSNDDKGKLIRGITEDAEEQAEKIEADARKAVEDRRKSVETQIRSVEEDYQEQAREQVRLIDQRADTAVSTAKRRASLKMRDVVMRTIISQVEERLEAMIGTPEYDQILLDWMTEGVLGLESSEVTVNASAREIERVGALVGEVQRSVKELTGRTVSVTPSTDDPLPAQGVVLTSVGRNTRFSNQVPTRLIRYQSEIQKSIYDIVFRES